MPQSTGNPKLSIWAFSDSISSGEDENSIRIQKNVHQHLLRNSEIFDNSLKIANAFSAKLMLSEFLEQPQIPT